MQLRIKSSNSKACIHALLESDAFAIKNATWCQLLELSNNHCDHERFQSSSKNDDENEASEAI